MVKDKAAVDTEASMRPESLSTEEVVQDWGHGTPLPATLSLDGRPGDLNYPAVYGPTDVFDTAALVAKLGLVGANAGSDMFRGALQRMEAMYGATAARMYLDSIWCVVRVPTWSPLDGPVSRNRPVTAHQSAGRNERIKEECA